ncbi:MAG: hypothetical protein HND48_16685 [Chloroflexi bacterium]|nr:hypothetical protein [Chloroflexota bacterium]
MRSLWKVPDVVLVIPSANLDGGGEMTAGQYTGYSGGVGIDPRLLPYLGLTAAQGELSLQPGEVIVGSEVGRNFFDPKAEEWSPVEVDMYNTPVKMKIYQWVGETPADRIVKLNVVAVLAPGSAYDYSILMPIEDVIESNEWTNNTEFDPETFVFGRGRPRARPRHDQRGRRGDSQDGFRGPACPTSSISPTNSSGRCA